MAKKQKHVRLDDDVVTLVDHYRRKETPIPSFSVAVNNILWEALIEPKILEDEKKIECAFHEAGLSTAEAQALVSSKWIPTDTERVNKLLEFAKQGKKDEIVAMLKEIADEGKKEVDK